MDTSVSSLVRIAQGLSPDQRADLAATLLAGLEAPVAEDAPPTAMVDRLWAIEVDFRIDDAEDRSEDDPVWEVLRQTRAVPGKQVRVVPRARAEVRESIALYQRTRPLLVALLAESLDEAVARVRREGDWLPKAPMTNPLRRVRRATIRGFPFQFLFHDDEAGDVRVLALAHLGRPPSA